MIHQNRRVNFRVKRSTTLFKIPAFKLPTFTLPAFKFGISDEFVQVALACVALACFGTSGAMMGAHSVIQSSSNEATEKVTEVVVAETEVKTEPAVPTAPVTVPVVVAAPAAVVTPAAQNSVLETIKNIPGVETLADEGQKGVTVTLNSDAFFQLGTAKVEEKNEPTLRTLAGALKEIYSQVRIEIEGHTDDSPVVKQKRFYPSNWELSAARAASVLHVLEETGFVKEVLKVVGYGDSRPLNSNRSDIKNRRIVLRVYQAAQEGDRTGAL